jgi:dUTPase
MKIQFTLLDAKLPAPPSQGVLFAAVTTRDGLYFPNDQRRDIPTGVEIDIPEGVTVKIRPLYSNEQNRLNVLPQTLYGPRKQPIVLTVVNNAPATTKLDLYAKLAHIAAYKTQQALPWTDATPEIEPSPPPPDLKTLVEDANKRRDAVGPSIFTKQTTV